MVTIVLYGLFILCVGFSGGLLIRKKVSEKLDRFQPIHVSHSRLLILSGLSLAVSFLIVRDQIFEMILMNQTGYSLTSDGRSAIPLFSIHQALNRLAVIPLAIGTPLLFCGSQGRYLIGSKSFLVSLSYFVLITCVFMYGFMLGNKAESFAGLITGVLIYLSNTPRARIGILAIWGSAMFMVIALVDYIRTVPLGDILSGRFEHDSLIRAPLEVFRSNEAFATHFSMYGVISHDVPLIYGKGVAALVTAFVPRILWSARPAVTYAYYAEELGLPIDQGFTLHHATGWYLNFGVPGVIIGGSVLGIVWASLFRKMQQPGPHVIVGLVGFTFITGGMADFVRAGIASYKGLVLYNIIFPWLVAMFASGKLFSQEGIGDFMRASKK
jgi:hypothetical protein